MKITILFIWFSFCCLAIPSNCQTCQCACEEPSPLSNNLVKRGKKGPKGEKGNPGAKGERGDTSDLEERIESLESLAADQANVIGQLIKQTGLFEPLRFISVTFVFALLKHIFLLFVQYAKLFNRKKVFFEHSMHTQRLQIFLKNSNCRVFDIICG